MMSDFIPAIAQAPSVSRIDLGLVGLWALIGIVAAIIVIGIYAIAWTQIHAPIRPRKRG